MKFNFEWLVSRSKSDSLTKALVDHFRDLDIRIPHNSGIKKLRDVLLHVSDRPFFWLHSLEAAWRVYAFHSEGMYSVSYSPNFKRLSVRSRKIAPSNDRSKNRQKNAKLGHRQRALSCV